MQSTWDEKTEMRVEVRRMTDGTDEKERVMVDSSGVKVKIDSEQCSCPGLCADICPEVFQIKDDGAMAKFTEIPARFEAACREAAKLCPTRVISVK